MAVSDPEAQGSSVTLVQKRPLRAVSNAGDYRASLVRGLVYAMINARFTEIARRADAPFLGASVGEGSLGRDVETLNASARVNDGGIEKGPRGRRPGARSRARQHGFGEAELDRAKKDLVASCERACRTGQAADRRTRVRARPPFPECGACPRNRCRARPLPPLHRDDYDGRRCAAVLRDALKDDNRVVIAVSPAKAGIPEVTEARSRTALDAGAAATVEPWRDDTAGRELLAKHPTRARFGRAVKFPRSASPC